jgi:putative ABC transport system substrate-binding protein
MQRREFIAGIGAAMVWPLAARGRERGLPMVGFLGSGSAASYELYLVAFHSGLSEVGYVEGEGVSVEYRWADGHYDRLPALAADLVGRGADVIVTSGGTPSARAAHDATSTIPIVFAGVTDPVRAGFVANLARPGGNLTGFSDISNDLTAKRLELIAELIPGITSVAFLVNPNNSALEPLIQLVEEAARTKSVKLVILKASTKRGDRCRLRHL